MKDEDIVREHIRLLFRSTIGSGLGRDAMKVAAIRAVSKKVADVMTLRARFDLILGRIVEEVFSVPAEEFAKLELYNKSSFENVSITRDPETYVRKAARVSRQKGGTREIAEGAIRDGLDDAVGRVYVLQRILAAEIDTLLDDALASKAPPS